MSLDWVIIPPRSAHANQQNANIAGSLYRLFRDIQISGFYFYLASKLQCKL